MKNYLLHIVVLIVTFTIGIGLVSLWLHDLYSINVSSVKPPPGIKVESPKLAYTCKTERPLSPDDENFNGFGEISCICSDSTSARVEQYPIYTKKEAYQKFERVMKSSSKIISVTPILDDDGAEIGKRALLEGYGVVKILTLEKAHEIGFSKAYILREIEANDYKHAIALENEQFSNQEKYLQLKN